MSLSAISKTDTTTNRSKGRPQSRGAAAKGPVDGNETGTTMDDFNAYLAGQLSEHARCMATVKDCLVVVFR